MCGLSKVVLSLDVAFTRWRKFVDAVDVYSRLDALKETIILVVTGIAPC